MKRYVVYTAHFGDYDDLLPTPMSEGCDYVCFTDDPSLSTRGWHFVVIEPWLSPSMMNRYFKILPHLHLARYEASLYVDSNIEIKQDPCFLFEKYLGKGAFFSLKHQKHNDLVSEAISCVVNRQADFTLVRKQIAQYVRLGFKDDYGLTENRILLRKHNAETVVAMMEDWWEEMKSQAKRDQLSLSYVCWKRDFQIGHMDENPVLKNSVFQYHNHRGSRGVKRTYIAKFRKLVRMIFFHFTFFDIRLRVMCVRLVDNIL